MENETTCVMGGTGLWVPASTAPAEELQCDRGVERYKRITAARSAIPALANAIDRSIGYAPDADTSARGLVAASRRAERIARRLLRDLEAANDCR